MKCQKKLKTIYFLVHYCPPSPAGFAPHFCRKNCFGYCLRKKLSNLRVLTRNEWAIVQHVREPGQIQPGPAQHTSYHPLFSITILLRPGVNNTLDLTVYNNLYIFAQSSLMFSNLSTQHLVFSSSSMLGLCSTIYSYRKGVQVVIVFNNLYPCINYI